MTHPAWARTTDSADSSALVEASDSPGLRLRCSVHRMRALLAKLPESRRAEVKAHLLAIRDAPMLEARGEAVKEWRTSSSSSSTASSTSPRPRS